ncbi:hypothetical protein KUCAC02_002190 [Chaenocephalus aceratus]|uniref:Uncharacterized protein n=1 Tax=Chaenocephalus aceratus TaxID=36190 RepID=A0ACB9XUH3_CHAAC|nr:hypothetical protein KUCAC02_002190 [Chaenocephalus aceratus]
MVLPPESVLLMPSCLSEQDQDDWLERRERNQMRSWSIKSLLPATVTLTPADTAGSTAGERLTHQPDIYPPAADEDLMFVSDKRRQASSDNHNKDLQIDKKQ